MPIMDGLEATSLIKNQFPQTIIIIVSAYND
jgi:YesN/AraC family two-component response regulator